MYTVNMYYCYCILHHAPLYHSCHSPPVFPNFCHLSPLSCSISLSSCSAFPTCCTILSVSSHFSQFLSPFPLYRSFSEFDLLPFFYLFLPPSLSSLFFFPVHIPHFPALFLFPFFSVPSLPLLFTFQFLLLFVQELMSFLLSRSRILFSVPISFAHFPFPLLHFLSSYHPSLFPNSLALPSSSNWCSVSSLFVLDVTSFFVHWDEIMRVVKPLGHC